MPLFTDDRAGRLGVYHPYAVSPRGYIGQPERRFALPLPDNSQCFICFPQKLGG